MSIALVFENMKIWKDSARQRVRTQMFDLLKLLTHKDPDTFFIYLFCPLMQNSNRSLYLARMQAKKRTRIVYFYL